MFFCAWQSDLGHDPARPDPLGVAETFCWFSPGNQKVCWQIMKNPERCKHGEMHLSRQFLARMQRMVSMLINLFFNRL